MKILFRHGQCSHNISNKISCSIDSKSELTENGRNVVRNSAINLKEIVSLNNGPIKIFSSPLLRTRQTSEVICDVLGLNKNDIIFDNRLKEVDYGTYDEKLVDGLPYNIYDIDKFGGETYNDIHKRIISFMNDSFNVLETIIIVSHAIPVREMHRILTGIDDKIRTGDYFIVKNY